jgi:hypothetical protein
MAQQPLVGRDGASSLTRLHNHTQLYTLRSVGFFGRVINPTHSPLPDNTHTERQTFMPLTGFEAAISASKWPQTHALDRAATWIGFHSYRPT